jgi:hypothetical protein
MSIVSSLHHDFIISSVFAWNILLGFLDSYSVVRTLKI